jgi:hypothetical protein
MNEARTISISIRASATVVYQFISDPAALPKWSLFVISAQKEHDGWQVQTKAGVAHMRFVAHNNLGVVDHWVRVAAASAEIYVPLRVIANGEGSEVLFTVFRQPGMDDAAHENDLDLVRKDLAHLKSVLESRNA